MPSLGRIRSLDGVRGVAALVVMLYHVSLIARPHVSGELWAWLTQSPLKLLFVGTESVLVFFVLSGLVVALPALKEGFGWTTYYPHRVLRLYLPVIMSLVLAAILIVLIPRDPATVPEGSWMRDAQASTVSFESLLSEASLFQTTYDINNVLWSLRWELFFSLLLPVFVIVASAFRKYALLLGAACGALTVVGRITSVDALVYLPVFMMGTLIAVRLEDIVAWGARERRRRVWIGLAATAALFMVSSWVARPIFESGTIGNLFLWGLAGTGAAIIIVLAVAWPACRRLLEVAPVQWLGKISFSLYLVHAPILGTFGFLFGDELWWMSGVVGVPVSLAVAAGFYSLVEAPSQKLSRRVGRWSGRVVRRAPATQAS
ncbi:acyltransferase family protein [Paramicrobacterium agarici]|uniref:Peptidoglycan/LPS O-acetylase OafA/YrhL n=1 Tax=Paramicrobacterium agarici TaxID=630514 RepID=A0A2A9DXC1_9MICO|nr:acyltransferase [Microbacterium agarici]PFG31234.1 peptidoglycan/LPS O-acetylase OafA/YrhL [Microbacterium agarici]TQO24336.1 peptidoglycan/LPS O-acetylase OafA/YrhL [Microbacterium agarici]